MSHPQTSQPARIRDASEFLRALVALNIAAPHIDWEGDDLGRTNAITLLALTARDLAEDATHSSTQTKEVTT